MKWEELKFSLGNSSAKTFALQMTGIDTVLSLAIAVAAGASASAWGGETTIGSRAALAFLAAVSAYSSFVIVRVLVPFVMHLSFAHMMRLRLPFRLWVVSLLVVAGLCGAAELFTTFNVASVQLTLILASIMLTIRFFQVGSLLRLALAFSCAGGAVGISALGIVAPVVTLVLVWSMADRMLMATDLAGWKDRPHPGVVEYFTHPLVRTLVKWMFIAGFLVCGGLAFRFVLHNAGGFAHASHAWYGCVGLDGAVFLLMTAIFPLVVGLCKAGRASEVIERSGFGEIYVYMAIAPFTALFMLSPELVPALAGIDLRIEPHVLALASVVQVFNLLLAGVILLADIRCREFYGEAAARSDGLHNVMRVSYAAVSLAPLALVACAVSLSR